jgi:hypothetical protein
MPPDWRDQVEAARRPSVDAPNVVQLRLYDRALREDVGL